MNKRPRIMAVLVATLAMAALPAATAAASATGAYSGKTNQQGPVTITVAGGKVTSVYIGVVGDCSLTTGGTAQWTYTFHKSVKIKHGKISYHTMTHGYAIDLTAHLKGKTIKGTLDSANPGGCFTPQIKFSAHK